MIELKPCPFCGGEAYFDRKGTRKVSCIVKCSDCDCTLETGETWESGKSWNTRTSSEWINKTLVPALNKCFPSKLGCDGFLLVRVDDYNELVELINKAKEQG
jgi:hypothetical protein